jgi:hypothetical protein
VAGTFIDADCSHLSSNTVTADGVEADRQRLRRLV